VANTARTTSNFFIINSFLQVYDTYATKSMV